MDAAVADGCPWTPSGGLRFWVRLRSEEQNPGSAEWARIVLTSEPLRCAPRVWVRLEVVLGYCSFESAPDPDPEEMEPGSGLLCRSGLHQNPHRFWSLSEPVRVLVTVSRSISNSAQVTRCSSTCC